MSKKRKSKVQLQDTEQRYKDIYDPNDINFMEPSILDKVKEFLGGDFTPPGYNYLGPGNKLNKGPPRNKADELALKHDIDYGNLEDKGISSYKTYSDEDEEFINKMLANEQTDDFKQQSLYNKLIEKGARTYFQYKRTASDIGLINKHSKKRKHGYYFGVEPTIHPKEKYVIIQFSW